MDSVHVFRQEADATGKAIDYLAEQLGRLERIMIDPQEFGALKAELTALRRDQDRIVVSLEQLSRAVQTIQSTMNEARGGWRAVVFVGGIGASLGGVLSWALQHVKVQ